MIQYCFLVCNYLSADLIPDTDLYNFRLSYLFYFVLDFLLFYMCLGVSIPLNFSLCLRFVSLLPTGLLRIHKVCESVTPPDFSVYTRFGSLLPHWTSPYTLLDQCSSGLLRLISAGSALLWASPYICWISTPLGFSL